MDSSLPEPNAAIFIIFGAAGDLARRKIIPALFNLYKDQHLPKQFAIYSIDRVEITKDQLIANYADDVREYSNRKDTDTGWPEFSSFIFYQQGDFKSPSTYQNLGQQLQQIEQQWQQQAIYIFYLATPPFLFSIIPPYLSEAGLLQDKSKARLVIEKPFGYDLESAHQLNQKLLETCEESQIFRIDHYLGKNTVRNILAFRFANPMFEPVWNRRYIDAVEIHVTETIGIEQRGDYYDKAGALRDMVQNHLMQLLCLVAMEPIISFQADEVRNKKVDVLHSIRPLTTEDVPHYAVRGQYDKGMIDNKQVQAYRSETGIDPQSQTETFVALKLFIDNWRWQGVPFFLSTGKHLDTHESKIIIYFRDVPHRSFPKEDFLSNQPAKLILSIQPTEEISMQFYAKQPGHAMQLELVNMTFNYATAFKTPIQEAYETLLWDIILNDQTQFMRIDQVEASWSLMMPILEAWKKEAPQDFPNYEAGSSGPLAVKELAGDLKDILFHSDENVSSND